MTSIENLQNAKPLRSHVTMDRADCSWFSTGPTNSPALRVTLTLSVFLAGLEKDATDLAAMLNDVLRLAGLSDRSESLFPGAMVTWLLKNKLQD